MRARDDSSLVWRRSSYSGGGNDCVEIAAGAGGVALRDSKKPAAGTLWVPAESWRMFVVDRAR